MIKYCVSNSAKCINKTIKKLDVMEIGIYYRDKETQKDYLGCNCFDTFKDAKDRLLEKLAKQIDDTELLLKVQNAKFRAGMKLMEK